MKELFRSIIAEFHSAKLPEIRPRNFTIPCNSGKIITLVGVRRCGKTSFFYQTINELLKTIDIKNIIYINFEDERIINKAETLQLILESYYELYPNITGELYLFFDEIQEIDGWEKYVARVYSNYTKNIFITGSSSKMLSKEIATSLRGKSISYELFPLSFREVLSFNNTSYENIYSPKDKAILLNAFNEYLLSGGFPEIQISDKAIRTKILQSYYNVMIYRDITERYNLTNLSALKFFLRKGIDNVANLFSVSKIYNELKSQGIKVSKDSVHNFLTYSQDCYLFFTVPLYSKSISLQSRNNKKLYCIDSGLANNLTYKFTSDYGKLLENLVYIELRRKYEDIFYYQDNNECDFIVTENSYIKYAIQVTYDLNEGNEQREINGLLAVVKNCNLKEGFILTLNSNKEVIIDELLIHIIPVWKWLLEYF